MAALFILLRSWRELSIGLLCLALVGCAWAMSRKDAALDACRQANAQTTAKLELSNASIGTLTDALNRKNAEADARARSYAATRAQDAQDVAAADKARDADRSRAATLQALAREYRDRKDCPVPSALVKQLEGL